MDEMPTFLKSGERARLFPVLAETSKEGRALSVLLSCFVCVNEYGSKMLGSVGQRVGVRTKIDVYTEVVFSTKSQASGRGPRRPDGLIILTTGKKTWSALVEAKIGDAELDIEQIENYLKIARENGIDAVITLSNQFTIHPKHHPLEIPIRSNSKVALYHWSWMYALTEAALLQSNDGVKDSDQSTILSELIGFLSHKSTGVKSFAQMPACWKELVTNVRNEVEFSSTDQKVRDVITAWHQETRDLCLIMSRISENLVFLKLPKKHKSDPRLREADDAAALCDQGKLYSELSIPGIANTLKIVINIKSRKIHVSMTLTAPRDKQSSAARVNWLMRQIARLEGKMDDKFKCNYDAKEYFIRAHWPGRTKSLGKYLPEIRQDTKAFANEGGTGAITSFDVELIRDLGNRFTGTKNFIKELEKAVPDFFGCFAHSLESWIENPPRNKEKKAAQDVSPAAIQSEFGGHNQLP